MYEYGIGGQERKGNNANEAITDLSLNRTLLVQHLTADPPVRPQVVYNLKNVEEVFAHFQPDLEVELADAEGSPVPETFRFRSLSDFGKRNLINQSQFLQELNAQTDTYQKLSKQLKSNKILKSALENPDAKQAFLAALQSLINELESI
jgi:hypothetical protein